MIFFQKAMVKYTIFKTVLLYLFKVYQSMNVSKKPCKVPF